MPEIIPRVIVFNVKVRIINHKPPPLAGIVNESRVCEIAMEFVEFIICRPYPGPYDIMRDHILVNELEGKASPEVILEKALYPVAGKTK